MLKSLMGRVPYDKPISSCHAGGLDHRSRSAARICATARFAPSLHGHALILDNMQSLTLGYRESGTTLPSEAQLSRISPEGAPRFEIRHSFREIRVPLLGLLSYSCPLLPVTHEHMM